MSDGRLRTSTNTNTVTANAMPASIRNAADRETPCTTCMMMGGSTMPATPLPTVATPTAVPTRLTYQRPVSKVMPMMPPRP